MNIAIRDNLTALFFSSEKAGAGAAVRYISWFTLHIINSIIIPFTEESGTHGKCKEGAYYENKTE